MNALKESVHRLTRPHLTMNDGRELFHLYCCDENLALCGLDLTEVPFTDGQGESYCAVCHDLFENQPCDCDETLEGAQ